MTSTKRPLLLLAALAAGMLFCSEFVVAQVLAPPVPVSVTPVAPTPVPVLPGGQYTFELPPPIASGPQSIELVSPTPNLTVTPLPNGEDGSIRREVTVSSNATPGPIEMQVVTDKGKQDVPVIVVTPPPPPNSEEHHHDGDGTSKKPGKSSDPNYWWLLICVVFVVGVVVGVVARHRH
jgi:hypothetical protein